MNIFILLVIKKEVLKLTASARDIETKIKSSIIEDDVKKENIYTDATIYENISMDQLMEYDNYIILHSKTHLNEEYDKIIELYNYIPKKKTHKFTTTQITFK
jgi:ABC-type sugar transport system ATPase subunit